MQQQHLNQLINTILEDMKIFNLQTLDIRTLTSMADTMIIASGNSERHIRASSEHLARNLKKAGYHISLEGLENAEWVVIDAGDTFVHIMQTKIRDFYQLEKLWGTIAEQTA